MIYSLLGSTVNTTPALHCQMYVYEFLLLHESFEYLRLFAKNVLYVMCYWCCVAFETFVADIYVYVQKCF